MPDDSANPTTQNDNTMTPPVDDFAAPAAPVPNTPDAPDAPDAPDVSNPTDAAADIAATSPASDLAGATDNPEPANLPPADAASDQQMYTNIANKISEAHNILIALSSNPSVDEMAAAIGLSLFLDKLGKRATAIYSGSTPNALEFLKPEETFEPSADVLQDFVIALNKEKADHLRYKLDGDFVKIYITPYQTKITAEDLEFSYGDFNVDLVLSLDIANGVDLDSALREHGRIMHDAVIINLTTGNPGKFGEIEWSDTRASSVSEMVARLLYSIKSDVEIGKEEATAFLTGIIAATNRFSKANTTPETMQVSSKLMSSGANQQLIAQNITPDIDNEMVSMLKMPNDTKSGESTTESTEPAGEKEAADNSTDDLNIEHDGKKGTDEVKESTDAAPEKDSALLDDLKAAEASLAQTGSETTPDTSNQPVRLGGEIPEAPAAESEPVLSAPAELQPSSEPTTGSETSSEPGADDGTAHPYLSEDKPAETNEAELPPVMDLPDSSSTEDTTGPIGNNPEKVIAPPADFSASTTDAEADKYGRMLEEALSDLTNPGSATALNNDSADTSSSAITSNPAVASTPEVPSEPEINGVPEMNFMPPAGENILPPPPTPPIDMSADSLGASLPTSAMDAPAAPVAEAAPAAPADTTIPAIPAVDTSAAPASPQPAAPAPQATDAGAFKIPGM